MREIQEHELDAWLGTGRDGMSSDERAEFGRLVRAYHATQAGRAGEDADYAEEDTAAWHAAFLQAVGELDVPRLGRAYREAKTAAYAGAMVAALAGEISERQAARDATITQRTLRQLLRKTPRRPLRESSAGQDEAQGARPRSRHALPGVWSREE